MLFAVSEASVAGIRATQMHIQLLVTDIVRQTTVLIAQLSTTAGLRTPLAGIADQVFWELATELEAQGVGKKVVADMFGMALRGYQTKLKRIQDEPPDSTRTLWQDVYIELSRGSLTRSELRKRFKATEPKHLFAALRDMTQNGIAYASGRGDLTLYRLVTDAERSRVQHAAQHEVLKKMVLYLVASNSARSRADIAQQLRSSSETVDAILDELVRDGQLREDAHGVHVSKFEVPTTAESGWEVAVCDHFRAVATTVAAKVAAGKAHINDTIGGGTLGFRIHDQHPYAQEVSELLKDTRVRAKALWNKVAEYNESNPLPATGNRVTFYFGQNVVPFDESDADEATNRSVGVE